MKNFKELKVWQKGMEIAGQAFQLVSTFPNEERFALANQITRAATSIPSNIAEGSSRTSEKDYKRYLEISLGSAFELETQVLIAKSIHYGNGEQINDLLKNLDEEQKMLMAFINRLNK